MGDSHVGRVPTPRWWVGNGRDPLSLNGADMQATFRASQAGWGLGQEARGSCRPGKGVEGRGRALAVLLFIKWRDAGAWRGARLVLPTPAALSRCCLFLLYTDKQIAGKRGTETASPLPTLPFYRCGGPRNTHQTRHRLLPSFPPGPAHPSPRHNVLLLIDLNPDPTGLANHFRFPALNLYYDGIYKKQKTKTKQNPATATHDESTWKREAAAFEMLSVPAWGPV